MPYEVSTMSIFEHYSSGTSPKWFFIRGPRTVTWISYVGFFSCKYWWCCKYIPLKWMHKLSVELIGLCLGIPMFFPTKRLLKDMWQNVQCAQWYMSRVSTLTSNSSCHNLIILAQVNLSTCYHPYDVKASNCLSCSARTHACNCLLSSSCFFCLLFTSSSFKLFRLSAELNMQLKQCIKWKYVSACNLTKWLIVFIMKLKTVSFLIFTHAGQ